MSFQPDPNKIVWRLCLSSNPSAVFKMLNTDIGRSKFWAESAIETNGQIKFIFPNNFTFTSTITKRVPNKLFQIEYINGSKTTFILEENQVGGTDLLLTDEYVSQKSRDEVTAGWVSVLLSLKCAVDYSVDIRNHDPQTTWDHGYVEN